MLPSHVEQEIVEHLEYLLYSLSAFQSPEEDKTKAVTQRVRGSLHWQFEHCSACGRVE